jgi:uncharacterized LabA/DUF88 family protein
MEGIKELRLAVLIDADNVPSSNVKGMMEEIAKYGTPTFKRIYADWTNPHVVKWKNVLLENAITPIQQYSYTQGKNSTDSAMIIDAMDILYSGKVDGFCIVSSDSDFTRIATRLREAGMMVIGIGEKKTPTPFITACDKFIYLEILKKPTREEQRPLQRPQKITKAKMERESKPIPPPVAETMYPKDRALIDLLVTSINDLADEDGWVFLGSLGSLLLKKHPDFDPRNYGYSKLVSLVDDIADLDIEHRKSPNSRYSHAYVRVR